MGFIAFASAKGSPGVTTAIAALAATWPTERDLYIAELDPAGGDLVVRFEMATEPSLVGLAAAGRRGLDVDTFVNYTQHLPTGAVAQDNGGPARRVLLGPVAAEQAQAALSALRLSLPRALTSLGADVLVDCGRLDPGSPVEELACAADLLVVVARPVLSEVHHLASRLTALRPNALSLLVIGEEPYSVGEVAQAVRAAPLGTLPIDTRAAAALTTGHPNPSAALRRSKLLRSARLVAEGLAEWLEQPSAPDAAAAGGAASGSAFAGVPAPPPPPAPPAPTPDPAAGSQPIPPPPAPPSPGPFDAAPGAPIPPPSGAASLPPPLDEPDAPARAESGNGSPTGMRRSDTLPVPDRGAPPLGPPSPAADGHPVPPPQAPADFPLAGRGHGPAAQTSGKIDLPIPPRASAAMDPPPDLLYVPSAPTPPEGTEIPGARHFRRNNNEEAGR